MYKPIHMTQEWQREWKVLEKHLNILSWRKCLTWMRVSVWGSPVLFDTDPSGLVMRVFFWKVYLYAPLLKPQHNSAVNPAPLYARGAHLTGVTEVACWILIPDSPFSISWECKQPLGDRFNHVFIFSNFPPLEDLFSPTLTTVLHLPFISKLLFSGSPRWPGPELAHQGILWHLESSKNAVVCLYVEPKSAVVPLRVWFGDQQHSWCIITFIQGLRFRSVGVRKEFEYINSDCPGK